MVEGKDSRSVYILFPLVTAILDRCTGHEEDAPVTAMNTRSVDILSRLNDDFWSIGCTEKAIVELQKDIYSFKNQVSEVFVPHCPTGLSTLNIHLLYDLREGLRSFRIMAIIDASPVKYFQCKREQIILIHLYENECEDGGNTEIHEWIIEKRVGGPHNILCNTFACQGDDQRETGTW